MPNSGRLAALQIGLRREINDRNFLAAGRTALEIADELLDHVILTPSPQQRLAVLTKAVHHGKKAVQLFTQIHEQVELPTAHGRVAECYRLRADVPENENRFRDFQHAIDHNSQQTRIAQELGEGYLEIQRVAYKNHGDTFLMRGQSEDCARHDDFVKAKNYYERERRILDQMTDNDYDGPAIRRSCLHASNLNLVIVYTKLVLTGQAPVAPLNDAQHRLEESLKASIKDVDPEDQRAALFALWNASKAKRELARAIEIQRQELALIRQHDLGGEVECLRDIVDTYRIIGEYDHAVAACEEILRSQEVAKDVNIRNLVNDDIQVLIEIREKESLLCEHRISERERGIALARLASLFYNVCHYEKAKLCIEALRNGEPGIPEQTLELLGLYADTLWAIKATPYTVVLKAHKSYMDAININFPLDSSRRRELLLENIAQLERVHEYYGHYQEAEDCAKEWARLGNKASEVLYNDEEETSLIDSLTSPEDEDITILDVESNKHGPPQLMQRNRSQTQTTPITSSSLIKIAMTLNERHETLVIPYTEYMKNVEGLITETERKVEEVYKIKIKVRYLYMDDLILHPEQSIGDIVSRGSVILAVLNEVEQKSSAGIYKNVCTALDVIPEPTIVKNLEEMTNTAEACFASLGLELRTLKPVVMALDFVILNRLDLSQNMLDDASLALFTTNVSTKPTSLPHLSRLDLYSNRITADGLKRFLAGFDIPALVELNVSYNLLGDRALDLFAECVMKFSRLSKICMEYCAVRMDSALLDESELKSKYEACVLCVGANLGVNLANNPISRDGIDVLIKLLVNIPRIEQLDLSRLNRCTGWEELISLSRLLQLRELRLRNSNIGVSGAKAVGNFLKRSQRIENLDLAYCQLDAEACLGIADGLMLNTSLVSLNLMGNPLISEHGSNVIAKTFDINPRSSLKTINFAECDIKGLDHSGIERLLHATAMMELSYNGFVKSVEDLEKIARSVQRNYKFEQVTLNGCAVCKIPGVSIELVTQLFACGGWATVAIDERADLCTLQRRSPLVE